MSLTLNDNDAILIDVWSSVPNSRVRVFFDRVASDGQDNVFFADVFVTAGDRAKVSVVAQLGECTLHGVTVIPFINPGRRGQTYVRVSALQALDPAFVRRVLLSDYVTADYFPSGSPQGRIISPLEGPGFLRTVTGSAPAAGQEFSITVPTNARWRIRHLRATLTTDATAVTRVAQLTVSPNDQLRATLVPSVGQDASLTRAYNLQPLTFNPGLSTSQIYWLGSEELVLSQGAVIRSATFNLKPGDTWSGALLYVEEWIEE
jgi:hypothetical protein